MPNKHMRPTAPEANTCDVISSLPDELLHRILSFTTAQEAVQTCTLSTRWLHIWQSLPCLNIEAREFTSKMGFVKFTYNLIQRCGCIPLDNIRLRTSNNSVSLNHDRANLWVRYALSCNVDELVIIEHYELLSLDHSSFTSAHLRILGPNIKNLGRLPPRRS
uniref:F-box domain-containing protein n=1 Tax=Arundo donax TaxID=35708 RepID=A0A0A9FNL4_ARUDO